MSVEAPETAAVAEEVARGVEVRLADLLARVIDWLKFAEAKNTGAVGLASTGLGVIVTFLVAGPPIPDIAGAGMAIGAVMLMVSLMLAVASFLPTTNLEKFLLDEREQPGLSDNLLFYGHLARYEPRALTRAIAQHYFDTPGSQYTPSKLAVDYAGQVVTNARITVRKLALFKYSLLLFGFGVLIASAAMAFSAVVA
ncbi:MAG: hypothetical protein K0Q71_439 [Thermomicrobiales bacterium]|jgi:hypothetical protein|nr:hypothetical protein [Thermomicrobiales bacterium]